MEDAKKKSEAMGDELMAMVNKMLVKTEYGRFTVSGMETNRHTAMIDTHGSRRRGLDPAPLFHNRRLISRFR